MTSRIELSAGTIEYEDTGGEGPAIVQLLAYDGPAHIRRRVVAKTRDALGYESVRVPAWSLTSDSSFRRYE